MQDVAQVSFFSLSFLSRSLPFRQKPVQSVCRLQVCKEPTPLNDSCRWLCAWHGLKTVGALLRKLVRVALVMLTCTVVVPLSAQAMPTATCAIKTVIGLQKSTVNLAALSTVLATPMLTVRVFFLVFLSKGTLFFFFDLFFFR